MGGVVKAYNRGLETACVKEPQSDLRTMAELMEQAVRASREHTLLY